MSYDFDIISFLQVLVYDLIILLTIMVGFST